MGNNSAWKLCEECGHGTKSIRNFQNKFLCYRCYFKHMTRMPGIPAGYITLEEALDKVREVKCTSSNTNPIGHLHLPRILIGRKVKLILIE